MSSTGTNHIGRAAGAVRAAIGAAVALTLAAPGIGRADAPPPPSPTGAMRTEQAGSPSPASWLDTVNAYRAQSGLPPVTEAPAMTSGAHAHSCYMVGNDTITHDEVVGAPGYTDEGSLAGKHGNVAVSSAANAADRTFIDIWMAGPFHADGILRRELHTVGFGSCTSSATPKWKSAATLNVLDGLGPQTVALDPVLFPGDGAVTYLTSLVPEQPDPAAACGWGPPPSGTSYGLPVFAMMPEAPTGAVMSSLVGPTGPVAVCTLSELNTTGKAHDLLAYDHQIVAVPRAALTAGRYTATVASASRTVTWSFTVDPDAARRPIQDLAARTRRSVGFQAIVPTRLVDTRADDSPALGATRLTGQVSKQIHITGGAVPTGATAASANFTVTRPVGDGFLTVWNCEGPAPLTSTVNFRAGETVPNAGSIALDPSGNWCVQSNVDTDLIIDVSGYYGLSAPARFTPMVPTRLLDTRADADGLLAAGSVTEVTVGGANGIPGGVQAIALNVTSDRVADAGFVTVYPCDGPRPSASNLNPVAGAGARSNLVISPVSASGTVCLFTQRALELVVDATGWFGVDSTAKFAASTPFRLLDTRDGVGLAGGEIRRVKVAGAADVPFGASGVSLNLTVSQAASPGFVTAFPCDVARPLASTVNHGIGDTVPNGAQLSLSVNGEICLYANTPVQVVLDVNGWWS
jgi:uncharacterized protein YkwD